MSKHAACQAASAPAEMFLLSEKLGSDTHAPLCMNAGPRAPGPPREKQSVQLNKLGANSKQETHLTALALIPVKDRILFVVQVNQ